MGLDVYLYRIDDYNQYKTSTEKYQALSEAQWSKRGGYSSLTDEQKEEARKEDVSIAKSLGLQEDGDYPGMVKVENDSRLYPEHMFKIGYLRSSYNSGGINSLLRDRLGVSLDEIFGNDEGEYEFQPDWQATRERAIKTLEDWRALNEAMGGKCYRVTEVGMNMFANPAECKINEKSGALKIFHEQLNQHKDRPSDMLSFGNGYGDFYLAEPLHVAALIPGMRSTFGGHLLPVVYAIYEATGEGETWYTQALEIVIENCEWVLEQPDKELYWLHWSS